MIPVIVKTERPGVSLFKSESGLLKVQQAFLSFLCAQENSYKKRLIGRRFPYPERV